MASHNTFLVNDLIQISNLSTLPRLPSEDGEVVVDMSPYLENAKKKLASALVAVSIVVLGTWIFNAGSWRHSGDSSLVSNRSPLPPPRLAGAVPVPSEVSPPVHIEVTRPPTDLRNFVKSFVEFAQHWEAQRVIRRESYAKYADVGINKLCLIIGAPTVEQVGILRGETEQRLNLLNTMNVSDSDKKHLASSIEQQFSFFTSYSANYRILEVSPYFSTKNDGWSFFYTSIDCDEIISQHDREGRENGFSGSGDEFPKRESGDRQYMEGRYSYLVTPEEFESLVPKNDAAAREYLMQLRRRASRAAD